MTKALRRSLGLVLVVALFALGGNVGVASASAAPPSLDCSATNHTSPCLYYCYPIVESNFRTVCGVREMPSVSLTGRYTYSVPMSAATQTASGIPGDPGATGTSNITLDLTNNRFCATTTWSGIDSKVAAGHIHQGSYGQPENPAVWISLMNPDFINGHQSGVSYCETVPAAELWVIKECPREFHTVVHSQNHPAGAIRGQLGTTCDIG